MTRPENLADNLAVIFDVGNVLVRSSRGIPIVAVDLWSCITQIA